MKRAIVLLSGGLDSATCLLIARTEAEEVFALSFDYGQRHRVELERARALAATYGAAAHRVVKLDLPCSGGLRADGPLARRSPRRARTPEPIPVTYVPARNTLFLSHAVAWGEAIGAGDLYIGANSIDYSGYPDCRPEFLESFERTANLGTKAGVEGAADLPDPRAPAAPDEGRDRHESAGAWIGFFTDTRPVTTPRRTENPAARATRAFFAGKAFAEAGLQDPLAARAETSGVNQP